MIGQRLCGPDDGWLQAVLNSNGNMVVAALLILAGVGLILFQAWLVPFEIVSILLLLSLVGAVVLAGKRGTGK